ncbi:MAG: hypothetical protein FWD05_05570 [Oscillospiraceae bacterium]|nr:hypothetical protein [Oscillospiraceae bacterium]
MNTNITVGLFTKSGRSAGDNTALSAHDQVKFRPQIDEIICQNLEGSALKDALFIVDNIRENKMKIKWSSVNVWTVRFRGRHVCDLTVVHGALRIGHVSDILATRVKYMSHDFDYTRRLIDAISNSMVEEPTASMAAV